MITRTEAHPQFLRLSGLSGFSKLSREASEELIRAICDSQDPQHASAVITACLRSARFVPAPADIYDLVTSLPADSAGRSSSKGSELTSLEAEARRSCKCCYGIEGWEIYYLLHTKVPGAEEIVEEIDEATAKELYPKVRDSTQQAVYHYARHCRCELGQYWLRRLRAYRASRDAAEAAESSAYPSKRRPKAA